MLMRTDSTWNPITDFLGSRPSELALLDAYRHGDVVSVDFELPGVDPSSIDVQVERGELRLSATRRRTAPEGAQFLVRERPSGQVTRRVMLGDVLDVDHVDAEYHDGVLTLRIPMRESAKPRRIDVRYAESPQPAITVDSA